jgi:hypothetical protein
LKRGFNLFLTRFLHANRTSASLENATGQRVKVPLGIGAGNGEADCCEDCAGAAD